jgi:ribosomal protein S18 acetylase RimI-like enzyme
MAESPAIRRLGMEDLPAVHALWKAAGLPFHPEGRDSIERLTSEMDQTRNFLLGAFMDGDMVGCVLASDEGRKGWVNRLAVSPDHRRSGVARQLVEACEEEFRSRGIGLVCALIEDWNAPSMALFDAAGYIRRDDIHYYRKEIRGRDW